MITDEFNEWQAEMHTLLGPELARAFDEIPDLNRWHLYGLAFCLYPPLRDELERLAASNAALLAACKQAIAYMEATSSDPDLYHHEMMEPLRAAVAEAEKNVLP